MRTGRLLIVLCLCLLVGGDVARADVFDDNPAAVATAPGNVTVFARGADGVILERRLKAGAWGDWTPVPGLRAGSGPGAVLYGSAVLLFARGEDGAVWQNQFVAGNWLGWISLGGATTSAPTAAVRQGTTTLDLFARGVDNTLHHRMLTPGQGWTAWESISDATLGSAPSASPGAGTIVVYVRALAGHVAQNWWNGTAWQGWFSKGGTGKGAPAAVGVPGIGLDLYARGLDDGLHRTIDDGTSPWQLVDPTRLSSSPAGISDDTGHEYLFARIGDALHVMTADRAGRTSATWSNWTSLGPIAPPAPGPVVTPPAADADRDGVPDTGDSCAALAGPAARSGCPSGLLADPSIRYRAARKSIRVIAYYVKATRGARVVVTCSRGCRRSTVTGRGSRAVKITRLSGRRLTNGTRITVTASLAGRLTTTVVDRVSRGRRVEGRPRCTPTGC